MFNYRGSTALVTGASKELVKPLQSILPLAA